MIIYRRLSEKEPDQEAVALKRLKKQIGALEDQLADKERKLTLMKDGLFHYISSFPDYAATAPLFMRECCR